MKSFEHINAGSVKEAVDLMNENKEKVAILAGGTDLLTVLKDRITPSYPDLVINIKTIPNLDTIEAGRNTLNIGALAKLADIARSQKVLDGFKVLAQASESVATPVLREMGTIGGNICQDVRCWYYRYPHFMGGRMMCHRKGKGPCFAIKGDNRYNAILGAKKCFAVCPSDTAIALTALGAEIVISGKEPSRRTTVEKFFTPIGNCLKQGELVTRIEIPRPPESSAQRFIKFTQRKPIDFAIVSVAAVIDMNNGLCANASIVLGGVAPIPYRAQNAEQILKGRPIDGESVAKSADAAVSEAKPLRGNAYKVEVAKTLVKRAILNAEQ
jgi:xanthine dehydrogenase YagS FAD-binding subunit